MRSHETVGSRRRAAVSLLPLFALLLAATAADAKTWWQTAVIYHIYPYSFLDSNGDGIGDLNGIRQKLEYVHGLGAEAVRLGSIFRRARSGCPDSGVVDFLAVDPALGTADDFDRLLQHAKELELKVILDLDPNHSSKEHEWFKQSVKRVPPYADYYVWSEGISHSGRLPDPPNNWRSKFGVPAWQWNPERKRFYLHQFGMDKPDLNYRNARVVQDMKAVLKFWLEKGVSGFAMKDVSYLIEDKLFRDEPPRGTHYDSNDYYSWNHTFTRDLDETFNLIREFKEELDIHSHKTDRVPRLLMVDVDSSDAAHIMKYYGSDENVVADFPINPFFVTGLSNQSKAMDYSNAVHQWYVYMHDGRKPNWRLGGPEESRVASRLSPYLVDGLNMLLLLLPGTAITYYGEELGMKDNEVVSWSTSPGLKACRMPMPDSELRKYRARTPFQWDASTSAGFSTNISTWLPVNLEYKSVNLHQQSPSATASSHYQVYRRLVATRQETSVRKGQLKTEVLSDSVYAFVRTYPDKDTFVVLINTGSSTVEVSLKPFILPKVLLVHTASINSKYKMSDRVHSKKLELQPHAALVLSTGKVHEYKYNNDASQVYKSEFLQLPLIFTVIFSYWYNTFV